jgi:DNA transposition AAA+ family ATPase
MQEIPFVETTVARRVFAIVGLARSRGENAAIVGEPGVGKTRALNEYAGRHGGVHMMTVDALTGNALRALLRDVFEQLGLYSRGGIADMQRTLRQYNFSDRVLIVDEAQNLKLQALRELLNLHDHAGMPVVFCGNHDVLKRVNVETGPLAQISDRIGLREQIDCIPSEDADAITNSFGVEGMDAYQLARAVGLRYRARSLVRVLNAARELAGTKIVKAAHIKQAIQLHPQYAGALK